MTKPTGKPEGRPRKYPPDAPVKRPPRHAHSISLTPEDERKLQALVGVNGGSINETVTELIRRAFSDL